MAVVVSVKREWRVVWQREGLDKKARRVKSQTGAERLALLLLGQFPDPDRFVCCSGYECPCKGITLQQRHAEYPPLVAGPVIESRPFVPWETEGGVR